MRMPILGIVLILAIEFMPAAPAFADPPTFLFRWGGSGSAPGLFQTLAGLALHPDQRIFAAEYQGYRIQSFSSGALLSTWSGISQGTTGISCDPAGNIYVVHQSAARILKYSASGALLATLGSRGDGDGQFQYPYGVASGPDGSVYVSDWYHERISKFAENGVFVLKWGSRGSSDGQFNACNGIAVGPNGDVYVVDRLNYRVQRFSSDGAYVGQWGSFGNGPGQFGEPAGITVDGEGNVYVGDSYPDNFCGVSKFTATGSFIWKIGSYGNAPGQFFRPRGVVVDERGNVYVADHAIGYVSVFGDPATASGDQTWGRLKALYR